MLKKMSRTVLIMLLTILVVIGAGFVYKQISINRLILDWPVDPGGFQLLSHAFDYGEELPIGYSEKGDNISPPLHWKNPPEGTRSYAIIAIDPDTPLIMPFVTHWILYNIPTSAIEYYSGLPKEEKLADGSIHGLNWKREYGYTGPNPPWGEHRYVFTIYALDTELEVVSRMSSAKLQSMMQGHILDKAQIIGTYSR